jgi:hypothetical protein
MSEVASKVSSFEWVERQLGDGTDVQWQFRHVPSPPAPLPHAGEGSHAGTYLGPKKCPSGEAGAVK